MWTGWEQGRVVWRRAWQRKDGALLVAGSGAAENDGAWSQAVLGADVMLPVFADPVMLRLAARYPGLRPYCDGSLFEGIITAIVGQSISVAAAAVTQAKLAALFPNAVTVGGMTLRPLPSHEQLADASPALVRTSGVTMRRAEALVYAAREARAGNLPDDTWAKVHPDEAVKALMALPQVGRWTAESTVLWGLGAENAHPTGDVALLRAARAAYNRSDMSLKDLDVLAEQWQPARALAARLLWTNLFGPAPGLDSARSVRI